MILTRRLPLFSTLLAFACLPLLLAGCGDGLRMDDGFVTRDSAGVKIVESHAPRWGASGADPVAQELLLQIGAAEGDGEELYRVGTVRFLDESHLALTNATTEIRVYDLNGALVHRFGREGEGPGEFRFISALSPLDNGRLLIADSRLRRISVTEPSGEVVRVTELNGRLPSQVGLVGDQFLVGISRPTGNTDGPRINRFVDSLVAVDTDTGEPTVWAVTPGERVVWRRFPNGLMGPFNFMISPQSTVAARGDRLVYGSSDVYELKELDARGELVRIIRRVTQAREVTDELMRPVIELWTERGSPAYAEPVFADSLPHFRSILLDEVGRTWVQREEGWSVPAPEWDLFDSGGAYLGSVLLPNDFQPYDIRDDKMVGVWRDSLGVEYVQVRRVSVPDRGSS